MRGKQNRRNPRSRVAAGCCASLRPAALPLAQTLRPCATANACSVQGTVVWVGYRSSPLGVEYFQRPRRNLWSLALERTHDALGDYQPRHRTDLPGRVGPGLHHAGAAGVVDLLPAFSSPGVFWVPLRGLPRNAGADTIVLAWPGRTGRFALWGSEADLRAMRNKVQVPSTLGVESVVSFWPHATQAGSGCRVSSA